MIGVRVYVDPLTMASPVAAIMEGGPGSIVQLARHHLSSGKWYEVWAADLESVPSFRLKSQRSCASRCAIT